MPATAVPGAWRKELSAGRTLLMPVPTTSPFAGDGATAAGGEVASEGVAGASGTVDEVCEETLVQRELDIALRRLQLCDSRLVDGLVTEEIYRRELDEALREVDTLERRHTYFQLQTAPFKI